MGEIKAPNDVLSKCLGNYKIIQIEFSRPHQLGCGDRYIYFSGHVGIHQCDSSKKLTDMRQFEFPLFLTHAHLSPPLSLCNETPSSSSSSSSSSLTDTTLFYPMLTLLMCLTGSYGNHFSLVIWLSNLD